MDPDTQRLHAFLTSPDPAIAFCADAGLSPTDLLAWLESPPIAAMLDAIERLELIRRRVAESRAARAAVERLHRLVLDPPIDDEGRLTPRAAETSRKAAAQLLRARPATPEPAEPATEQAAEAAPDATPRHTDNSPPHHETPDAEGDATGRDRRSTPKRAPPAAALAARAGAA